LRESGPRKVVRLRPHDLLHRRLRDRQGLHGSASILAHRERRCGGKNHGSVKTGDILLITENNYQAECCPGYPRVTQDEDIPDDCEIIFNGELCRIFNLGRDFVDMEFEENCDGVRRVRMLLNDGRRDATSCLPDGTAFGRAMSVHKGQGSQFPMVIVPTEVGYPKFGIVQRSIIYTAVSRGVDRLVIVGNFDDLVQAARTPDLPRNTLLRGLLVEGAAK
jgi:ATP-dependent exoDNAse (exonuclease V) alpha subunit